MGSSRIRDRTHGSCIGRQILYHWATREAPDVNRISLYWICYNIPSVFCFGFFWPQGTWDLSSSTRDWTCTSWVARWRSETLDHQGGPDLRIFKYTTPRNLCTELHRASYQWNWGLERQKTPPGSHSRDQDPTRVTQQGPRSWPVNPCPITKLKSSMARPAQDAEPLGACHK